jgi:hypothetical protein
MNGLIKKIVWGILPLSLMINGCEKKQENYSLQNPHYGNTIYNFSEDEFELTYPKVDLGIFQDIWNGSFLLEEKGIEYDFKIAEPTIRGGGKIAQIICVGDMSERSAYNLYSYFQKRKGFFPQNVSSLSKFLSSVKIDGEEYTLKNNPKAFLLLKNRADSLLKKIYSFDSINFVREQRQKFVNDSIQKEKGLIEVKNLLK